MSSIHSLSTDTARVVIDQRLREADHERRRRLARRGASYDARRSHARLRYLPGR